MSVLEFFFFFFPIFIFYFLPVFAFNLVTLLVLVSASATAVRTPDALSGLAVYKI